MGASPFATKSTSRFFKPQKRGPGVRAKTEAARGSQRAMMNTALYVSIALQAVCVLMHLFWLTRRPTWREARSHGAAILAEWLIFAFIAVMSTIFPSLTWMILMAPVFLIEGLRWYAWEHMRGVPIKLVWGGCCDLPSGQHAASTPSIVAV
jgi:hypothetical protein